MDESLTIACSPTEAAFLAGLLGADTLLGITDPFHGWLVHDIESAWTCARENLAGRRYIEIQANGKVMMDSLVATLISTWALADASVLLTATTSGEPTDLCNFHLTKQNAVEQRIIDDGIIRIMPVKDAAAVYCRTARSLRLDGQSAAPGDRAALPEAILSEARALAAKQDLTAARVALMQASLPDATANALAEALAAPITNGALAALARRPSGWEVAGMGVIEGSEGLWRLRSIARNAENLVEFTPCNAAEARAELRRVMNRVLPIPISAVEEESDHGPCDRHR